ncbi:MAG: DUF4410 domain-containing protein [Thermoanaerobaculia bacterium]
MSRVRVFGICMVLLFGGISLASAGKGMDEGRFEPGWFGAGTGEFREAEEVDYLWVKPGFDLAGKSVRFADWEEAVFLGEDAGKRDAKDKRLANDLTRNMAPNLAEAFRNSPAAGAKVVDKGEDITVSGRIVDCSTGSAAAKFWVGMGAGSGGTTFDMKWVDRKSGQVVVAMHHRVVSGSNLSTTDSKLIKWIDEFAEELGKEGFDQQYKGGKKVKD